MPKRGRRRKKNRTHDSTAAAAVAEQGGPQSALASSAEAKVPRSLVLRRGKTAAEVAELVRDVRHAMSPYTAMNLEEDAKNRKLTLRQYTQHLALPMGVSHILAFSQSDSRLNLRLARTPEGPTLSFRVTRFSLNRHIKATQRRPIAQNTPSLHSNPPVVVTHNFGGGGAGSGDSSAAAAAAVPPHIKLLRITFQNIFPAINVSTVKLRDCRRVVLFNLVDDGGDDGGDGEKGDDSGSSNSNKKKRQIVQMRHYAITAKPVGVNRRVRRLVQANRKLPNLHNCQDVADYLEQNALLPDGNSSVGTGGASDSEGEEDNDEQQQVVLPDRFVGRGNVASQRSALKLVELGPRLDLHLIKVEKGLSGGDVLYHAFESRTPEEAAELKKRKETERVRKQVRREQQESNVERKRQAAEEKRQAKRQRQQEREQRRQGIRDSSGGDTDADDDDGDQQDAASASSGSIKDDDTGDEASVGGED